MELILEKTSKDYIIKRVGGTYNQHSHYENRYKARAKRLIKTIKEGKRPIKLYDQIAAKRVLTKEEYESLKVVKKKQQYYNVGAKEHLKCYK